MKLSQDGKQFVEITFGLKVGDLRRSEKRTLERINAMTRGGTRDGALAEHHIERWRAVSHARVEAYIQAYTREGKAFDESDISEIVAEVERSTQHGLGSCVELDPAMSRHHDHLETARVGIVGACRQQLQIEMLNTKLAAKKPELGAAQGDDSSDLDPLMQIYNRGRFDQDLQRLSTSATSSEPLSLIMIDLDHFKRVNDTYGHPIGDEVLRRTAAIIQSVCKNKACCYRYGGEELSLLLPNYGIGEAVALAERVRLAISGADFQPCPEGLTVSLGVATYPETTKDPQQLVQQADDALYAAKENGRNCVRGAKSGGPNADHVSLSTQKRAPRGDVGTRVGAVEISMSLTQGVSQNYVVLVKNESDEEVSIKRLTLERNGLELSQPAKPKEGKEWTLAPRSGQEIAWSPTPDPVVTLQMSQSPPISPIDIEIVLHCQILGILRLFKRKILVVADYRNFQMSRLGGW